MVSLLASIVLRTLPPEVERFEVFHHVVLPAPLLQATDVRRDGSLVGSCGQMGLHDGAESPLIVIHGKVLEPINPDDLGSYHLAAALQDGRYELQDNQGHTRSAQIAGLKLILAGPLTPLPVERGLASRTTAGGASIDRLFPIPAAMRDTSANESVNWWPLGSGSRLGQVNTSTHSEYGHRAVLRDATGRLIPLEQCVPGMSGKVADGIWLVSPKGWFVVSASAGKWAPQAGIRVGFGNELFWIRRTCAHTATLNTADLGFGTSQPWRLAVSIQSPIESLISSATSCSEFPTDAHPGRSGT